MKFDISYFMIIEKFKLKKWSQKGFIVPSQQKKWGSKRRKAILKCCSFLFIMWIITIGCSKNNPLDNQGPAADELTVPSAPTEFTAQAIASYAIELRWQHDYTFLSSPFLIFRSQSGPFELISEFWASPGDRATYGDYTVQERTSYRYYIVARNDVGDSEPSDTVTVVSRIKRLNCLCNLPLSGEANCICIDGNFAYVADGSSGLQIISIDQPESPMIVGSYDTPGLALGIDILNDSAGHMYAYVADGQEGLQVIDVSDPSRPRLIEHYDTPGEARSVSLNWLYNQRLGYIFIADGDSGIYMRKFSQLPYSSYMGTLDANGCVNAINSAVSFHGLYELIWSEANVYIALGRDGYSVYRSQGYYETSWDLTSWLCLEHYDLPGEARDIWGNILVACGDNGVHMKIGPFSSYRRIDLDTPGYAESIRFFDCHDPNFTAEAYIFVADGGSGLEIYDIRDLDSISCPLSADTEGWAYHLAFIVCEATGYIFVADGEAGLSVFEFVP